MPTLLPFRDYQEKDVIGLYAFSGSLPQNKGMLVKVVGSGFVWGQEPVEMLGAPGASFANTVSQRYGVQYKVGLAGTGDKALGITLFDVKETDENGLPLRFNRQKAAELEAVISGQSLPIATKGRFMYSGITGAVTPGQSLYQGANGTIEANQASAGGTNAVVVGKALGAKDAVNGFCYVQLNFL